MVISTLKIPVSTTIAMSIIWRFCEYKRSQKSWALRLKLSVTSKVCRELKAKLPTSSVHFLTNFAVIDMISHMHTNKRLRCDNFCYKMIKSHELYYREMWTRRLLKANWDIYLPLPLDACSALLVPGPRSLLE